MEKAVGSIRSDLREHATGEVRGAADPIGGWHGRYELPRPSYEHSALSPVISAHTVATHYGRHHKAYVDATNRLLANDRLGELSLEEVVRATAHDCNRVSLFRNAAQAWNHAFYWRSLKPAGGGRPHGAIADRINYDFGGYDSFRSRFASAATGQFGSGWAWLVMRRGRLTVMCTDDADTPMMDDVHCVLVIDVWEHAYYLDYENLRGVYVEAVIDKLFNWDFANEQLAALTAG